MVLVLLGKKYWQGFHRDKCWNLLLLIFFLIYINDSPNDKSSICLLMILYFSQKSKIPSLSDINYDLDTKNQWPHPWKMSFNLDPNEEATEVLFSSKIISDDHTKLTFNGNQVQQRSSQNHLGLFQDNKIDFNKLLDEKINKYIKKLGIFFFFFFISGMIKKKSPYWFQEKVY